MLQAEAGFKIQPNSVNSLSRKKKKKELCSFENQPGLNKDSCQFLPLTVENDVTAKTNSHHVAV